MRTFAVRLCAAWSGTIRVSTSFAFRLVSHDVSTLIPAMTRVRRRGQSVARVLLIPVNVPNGQVIDDMLLLDTASHPDDWAAGLLYLPL